jgi:hypothetical protein
LPFFFPRKEVNGNQKEPWTAGRDISCNVESDDFKNFRAALTPFPEIERRTVMRDLKRRSLVVGNWLALALDGGGFGSPCTEPVNN